MHTECPSDNKSRHSHPETEEPVPGELRAGSETFKELETGSDLAC